MTPREAPRFRSPAEGCDKHYALQPSSHWSEGLSPFLWVNKLRHGLLEVTPKRRSGFGTQSLWSRGHTASPSPAASSGSPRGPRRCRLSPRGVDLEAAGCPCVWCVGTFGAAEGVSLGEAEALSLAAWGRKSHPCLVPLDVRASPPGWVLPLFPDSLLLQ